jgi:hypothetical protein
MSKQTFPCTACKGTKKITLVGHTLENGKLVPLKPVAVGCVTCDGKGYLTLEEKMDLEYRNTLWCKCEKEHDTTFVDDGVSDVCHKHHWTCNHCGKITQIG